MLWNLIKVTFPFLPSFLPDCQAYYLLYYFPTTWTFLRFKAKTVPQTKLKRYQILHLCAAVLLFRHKHFFFVRVSQKEKSVFHRYKSHRSRWTLCMLQETSVSLFPPDLSQNIFLFDVHYIYNCLMMVRRYARVLITCLLTLPEQQKFSFFFHCSFHLIQCVYQRPLFLSIFFHRYDLV